MPIVQDIGPNISGGDAGSASQKADTFYTQNITMNLSYWTEATYDLRFHIGEQGLMTEVYGVLPGRPHMYTINRVMRVDNAITGFQRRNRKSLVCIPIENGNEKTADQLSKVLFWIDQTESLGELVSDTFEGAVITGMYMIHTYMDYRKDPISGDIKFDMLPYNSFIMDTFTRKHDLSDCKGIMRRSYVTKEEAMTLLPNYMNEISGMEEGQGARDAKFQYLPEVFAFDQTNQLLYDEYYYRDYRKQKVLVDRTNGDTNEYRYDDEEFLAYVLQNEPMVTVCENIIPTVKQAILVNNRTIVDEYHELDEYPFVPFFTYFYPEVPFWNWRVCGIPRQIRDVQYLFTRRRMSELDALENRVSNAFAFKPDALMNIDDINQTGGGRHIGIKREYEIGQAIQPLPMTDVPQSWFQESEALSKEIDEIPGLNDSMFGSATDQRVGILEMLKQGAGLTILQPIFDRLDRSCKLLGRKILKYVQNNYTPGKVARIIGEKPTQEFYDKMFLKYDCSIEEGVNTTTQKQNQFITLVHLKEIGVPIPNKSLIKAATIQNKSELIEDIEKEQQEASKMQQMQMQVQMQELQARAQLSQARAKADTGLYYERTSRVQENLAAAEERKHEAAKDDNIALLNLVKALKEIDTMDLDQIEKLLTMANVVKQQEQQTQNQTAQEAAAASNMAQEASPQNAEQQQTAPQQPEQPQAQQPSPMSQGMMQ